MKKKLLSLMLAFAMAFSLAPSAITSVSATNVPALETKQDTVKQSPTVETNLPEKVKVEETVPFTVSTKGNDFKGTYVIGDASYNGPAIKKLEYKESKDGKWYEMPDFRFGPADGFPLGDFTSDFRVTFAEAGDAVFTIKICDVNTKEVLASVEKTLKVESKVAPTVEANLPETIKQREAFEFEVSTIANDYKGTMVVGTSSFEGPAIEKIEYKESNDGKWYELTDIEFGPKDGFPLGDFASQFRVTFAEAGEANFTIYIKDVATQEVLASVEKTIDVLHVHNLEKHEAVKPTCEEDGNIEYYTCDECLGIFSDAAGENYITDEETVLKATGHKSDEGKVTKPATTEEEGLRTYTCTVCDKVLKTETIEKLPVEPEQDMINLTLKAVVDGEELDISKSVSFPQGYVLTADDIADLNDIVKEALKDQNLDGYEFKGFFLDKEGKKELEAGYGFDVDATIYMVWEKEGETTTTPTPDTEKPTDNNKPTKPTTTDKESNDTPKTGDESQVSLYASLAALSVVGAVIVVFNKKREELMK